MLVYVEFGKPIDDYVEANSYSFGVASSGSGIAGGGAGRAQRNDFQFTKDRDYLSSVIMGHLVAGTVFGTVWVELYRDAYSDVYITYTLSNVTITSFNSSSGITESVGLNFKTAKSAYFGR